MITIKSQLEDIIKKEIARLWPALKDKFEFEIERPKEERYGDYSTNLAMKLSAILERGAVDIGRQIVEEVRWPKAIDKVLVAAPGFINFYLSRDFLRKQLTGILRDKRFGQSDVGENKKVQIEFISANPTGPLHVGNGRGGFMGDCLANVMKTSGFRTQREYYINDLGNQADILSESVTRRYFQSQKIQVEYPDYCYQGEYVKDLAKRLNLHQYKIRNIEELKERVKTRALNMMIRETQKLVQKKLRIKYDRWFSEKSLYKNNAHEKIIKILKDKNLTYIKDGAIWFRAAQFGDDKDRVLVKKDGSQTYFLSDILYHLNKFSTRKFDKVINIWGADHYGDIKRVQAAMKVLGFENRLDILMVQLVRIIRRGQEVKMSKRAGTYVTLEELVDEVGLDAARFFFLMNRAETHMDFDLDLAKEKSDKNPVYYVQYAHARICSIIKNAAKYLKKKNAQENENLSKKEEFVLLKKILELPEIIQEVALSYEVHRLPFYAQDLATKFHDFYTKCRVLDIDRGKMNKKRYDLIKLTKFALMKVLELMGVSAPERM